MWQRAYRQIGLPALTVLALLSYAYAQTTGNHGKSPLRTVADVPLPGAAVRFDYQSLDGQRGIDERSSASRASAGLQLETSYPTSRRDAPGRGPEKNKTRGFGNSFVLGLALWIPVQVLQVAATA